MTTSIDANRLAIAGELTINTAAAERERLLAALEIGADLEVDLSQVTEIDGAGMQLMLAARNAAQAQHIPLRFSGHSAAVLDLLDLCGLTDRFDDPPSPRHA